MVDKKIVEYVAKLAKIQISEEEKSSLGAELSKILDYIDKLKTVDAEGALPMRGLHAKRNVFRADKSRPSSYKDKILNNAPATEGDYFKIPKVIE